MANETELTMTSARRRALDWFVQLAEYCQAGRTSIAELIRKQDGIVNLARSSRDQINEPLGFVVVAACRYGEYDYDEFPESFQEAMQRCVTLDMVGLYADGAGLTALGSDAAPKWQEADRYACVACFFAPDYHALVKTILQVFQATIEAIDGWDQPLHEGYVIQIRPREAPDAR